MAFTEAQLETEAAATGITVAQMTPSIRATLAANLYLEAITNALTAGPTINITVAMPAGAVAALEGIAGSAATIAASVPTAEQNVAFQTTCDEMLAAAQQMQKDIDKLVVLQSPPSSTPAATA